MPQDPDFSARVHDSFDRQSLMQTIGARLARVDAGAVDIELDWSERLVQQHGYLHAGVITSALDSACGYAAFTLMPPGSDVLSVEFKVNLLRPAAGTSFAARARVLRAGRTLTITQADMYAREDGAETHIATMLATMMRVQPRADANATG